MIYLFYACAVPSCRSIIYLFIYLYLFWSLWKCATLLLSCVGRDIVVLCVLVLVWCGWLVVNRAFEPVERMMCLNVAIASLSRHGRSAKHIPPLGLSSFFRLLFS